ncbi:hypothetical protein Tco_1148009, partial [Tanacetum coccineum]
WYVDASDCTSLREVLGSSGYPTRSYFTNCPKLFKNVTIDSEGSILKTNCHDSSITSQGFIHQVSALLGYLGFPTNKFQFFSQYNGYYYLNIGYHGNSIPEWFTNRSRENHVKVELPSDWCDDKFRGFGICIVFKSKKPRICFSYSVKNFDGASLEKNLLGSYLKDESYMILFHYMMTTKGEWKEAKNFVTFSFEENGEDVEVKELGVRPICDEDIEQGA